MTCSNTQIMLQMKTKSNSRLRNPLVSVIGTLENIELAKERLLSVFENMRQRVVLKMDVSFKDHSHIIGRGGLSIQQVMDETGSHIHFPDSNRISDVKKSNVVLVCGNPQGVEQARCRIRRLLPLIVHFQIPLQLLKKVSLAAHSKHLRSIQQVYNVHVSIRYSSDIDEQFAAIFDTGRGAKYVAVSVRGVNNDLGSLREALRVLLAYLTDFSLSCPLLYTLTIEITEYYHQLVMGNGCANIRAIMQRTGCVLTFPEVEPNARHLDLDNLNEIPVNKSTVIVRGPSFEAVHAAWTELIGYLPLVLTFDLAHDQRLDTGLLNMLKKQHKVAIFLKHKEKFNTVIIRGVERHSKQLFEVRRQLLGLDESEIPDCCDLHASAGPSFDLLNAYNAPYSLHSQSVDHHQHQLQQHPHQFDGLRSSSAFPLDGNNNSIAHLDPANTLSVDKSIVPSLLANPELRSIFNPAVFQAVLKEQYLVLQQQQQLQQQHQHHHQQQQQHKQKHLAALASTHSSAPPLPSASIFSKNVHHMTSNAFHAHTPTGLTNSSQSHLQHYRPANSTVSFGSPTFDPIARSNVCEEVSRLFKNQFVSSGPPSSLTTSVSSPSLGQLALDSSKSPATSAVSCMALNSLDDRYSMVNDSHPIDSQHSMEQSTACVPYTSTSTTATSSSSNMAAALPNGASQNIWPDSKKLSYGECKYLALKATYEEPTANEVRIPSSVWSGFGFSKSMPPEALKNKLIEWNPMLESPVTSSSNPSWNGSPAQKYLESLNKPNLAQMVQQLSLSDRQRLGRPLLRQESEICSNSTPYSSNYLNGVFVQGNQHAGTPNQMRAQSFGRSDVAEPSSFGNHSFYNGKLHRFSSDRVETVIPLSNDSRPLQVPLNEPTFINVDNIDLSIVLVEFGLFNYMELFKQCGVNFARFLRLSEDELVRMGIPYAGRRKLIGAITELRGLLQSNRIASNFNATPALSSPTSQFVSQCTNKLSRLSSTSSLAASSSGLSSSVCVDSPNVSRSTETDVIVDSHSSAEDDLSSALLHNSNDYLETTPSNHKKVSFADDSTDEGLPSSSPIALATESPDQPQPASLSNVLGNFSSSSVSAN